VAHRVDTSRQFPLICRLSTRLHRHLLKQSCRLHHSCATEDENMSIRRQKIPAVQLNCLIKYRCGQALKVCFYALLTNKDINNIADLKMRSDVRSLFNISAFCNLQLFQGACQLLHYPSTIEYKLLQVCSQVSTP